LVFRFRNSTYFDQVSIEFRKRSKHQAK